MTDLLYMGSAVKALGGGKVAGYLVQYSDAAHPDLSRERDYFTADCDYDLDTGNRKSVFYAHGLDAKMGVKRIGVGEVGQDEVGVWIEAQLSLADEYGKAVYALAEQGKLGWSSGAPSHLVTRKAVETEAGTVHEITSWPLAEASLTPCPADHRNRALALKSLPALIGLAPAPENHTKALVYQPATDGDDADPAIKEADTDSALEHSALTFADHLDAVLAAVGGVIERAEDIQSYRIKSGRMISAANRDKMQRIHAGMRVAHDAMAEHMGRMQALLTETDPEAKKEIEDFAALRGRFLRTQSDLLHLTG
jgi:hypothetical protein